jgi:Protein of unknown function (DUF2950)
MTKDTTMRTRTNARLPVRSLGAAVALAMACFWMPARPAAVQAQAPPAFATPELAVEAAIQAAATDAPAMLAVFGPDGKDLVATSDPVQDQRDRAEFVRLAREKTTIVRDPSDPRRATLWIGKDEWPFAIPIVEANGKWTWSSAEGRYEVLVRRIGANELDTIAVCRGYVEAQQDYAAADPDKTGVHQYAQRIISTPGKRDGLYWKSGDGGPESPVSEAIARAIGEGYSSKSESYHGYHYKVLAAQGKSAPLGEMNFVVRGKMIGGFALVAWPAQYRVTGVKTFIVSHDGIVFQRDLGPNTVKVASAMTRFDPDKSWMVVEDEF